MIRMRNVHRLGKYALIVGRVRCIFCVPEQIYEWKVVISSDILHNSAACWYTRSDVTYQKQTSESKWVTESWVDSLQRIPGTSFRRANAPDTSVIWLNDDIFFIGESSFSKRLREPATILFILIGWQRMKRDRCRLDSGVDTTLTYSNWNVKYL